MSKAFASQADLADKKITFERLSEHCWAYTAEGDPNSGVDRKSTRLNSSHS